MYMCPLIKHVYYTCTCVNVNSYEQLTLCSTFKKLFNEHLRLINITITNIRNDTIT